MRPVSLLSGGRGPAPSLGLEVAFPMENWTRLGRVLGSHMMFIAPACVILGVLFPGVFGLLRPIVPVLFAFMTFQGSLNNNVRHVVEVFRHPKNMLAILVVSMVVMPVASRVLSGLLFANDPNLVVGATLEYCVPVAVVCFMWCDMYDGDLSLALATILVSTVLAPFTIPVSLKLLLGATVQVDVASMMTQMVFMIALPALAGMLVNDLTKGWGHKVLSPAISPAARILIMFIMAANSTQMSDYMRHITPELFGMMAYILFFATCGFLLGMGLARLMRVDQARFVTMTFGVGMRNISAGAVIAAQFFPGEVVFPVMMGTLFQQMLAGVFATVMPRLAGGGAPETSTE